MSIKIQRRDFLLGFGFLGLMQTNQLKAMVSAKQYPRSQFAIEQCIELTQDASILGQCRSNSMAL